MAMVHYTAKVQKNGSLSLPKEVREKLQLQPGDEVDISVQVEQEILQRQQEELRAAIDIGLEQLERGEYSVYTKDTLQNLVEEVKAEGRRRLEQARLKRPS